MVVASSACLVRNPEFGPDGAGSSGGVATGLASDASAADTGSVSTSPGTTAATSSTGEAGSLSDGGSTSIGATTGATEPASGSTDAATTGDASSSTSGAQPGEYEVQPTVATCVMLAAGPAPFAGPAVCSANASNQNATTLTGLMMIDTGVMNLDGMNRPAHSYLRFDVPAELSGLTVASATLTIQVADGPDDLPNGPQSGVLVRTDLFDAGSLEGAAPATFETLAGDQGFVDTNETVTWSIPTHLVVPGQPLLLGLLPTANEGVIYRGATTPGAPVLRLVMQ